MAGEWDGSLFGRSDKMADAGVKKVVISKPASKQETYRKIVLERIVKGKTADGYQTDARQVKSA